MEITGSPAGPHKDAHNHGADLCTPFCTCACCAATCIPVYHHIELQTALLFAEQAFAAYLPAAAPEVCLPIWQPPRLA
jgi:hypothetical protein